ncbi:hypothetical protein ACJMK2_030871 [Sinanodonta woodiana]|uniref:Nudix hydrolase domain-containing protein n=1 Tax=Sinanodonta woodiana TaxID=1069815 RepID=A0ABD3WYT4_SINWO
MYITRFEHLISIYINRQRQRRHRSHYPDTRPTSPNTNLLMLSIKRAAPSHVTGVARNITAVTIIITSVTRNITAVTIIVTTTAVRWQWSVTDSALDHSGAPNECTSVLAFRQQHTQPGAFGRSDLYVVCRMRPLTFELSPCSHEIVECQWMPVQELHKHAQISTITRRLTSLVMFGLEHGFNRVDIKPEQMESIHKGLKFHLFHRPLSDEWKS